jgi:hypothetical protein
MIGIDDLEKVEVNIETSSQGFSRDANAIRGFEMIVNKDLEKTLEFEYGANYLYMLATYIPRSIWTDKPLTAFEPRFTKLIFNDFSNGVWIFTAWGEGYAQFGILGIFLNLFFFGYIIKLFINNFQDFDSFKLVFFYNSILIVTFLRGGLQATFILFSLLYISKFLLINQHKIFNS